MTDAGYVDSNPADSTRVGLSLAPSPQLPLPALLELALLAERAGYDSLWIPETWGLDAVSLLAVLATRTSRIKLASGVFNVYSRSAALLAQTAATLQLLSGGRFILGLGTSGPIVVERWHGAEFVRPIGRTREYIEVIRTALRGERVEHEGRELRLGGFRLTAPPAAGTPIYVAALGPRNVRLAGETADGWLPIFAARGQLAPLFAELHVGLAAAGRDRRSIDVGAYLPAAIGGAGERLLRAQIAYYVGGMGEFYARFVARTGFAAEADRIHQLWQQGDRLSAVAAVDECMLEACTLGSVPAEAREALAAYRSEGLDLPIVVPAHGSTAQQAADTIDALAPR